MLRGIMDFAITNSLLNVFSTLFTTFVFFLSLFST